RRHTRSTRDWSSDVCSSDLSTHAVFPAMLRRGSGTIINVGSTAGRNVIPKHTPYCGTKHAVHAMSEGLRREGAAKGVRVIVVSQIGRASCRARQWIAGNGRG